MAILTDHAVSLYEQMYTDTTDDNHNMLIPWYLMSAYAYYVEDDPIISDGTFDRLCKKLLDNFDTVEHIHKEYVTEDALIAGTYLGKYPSRMPDVLIELRRTYGR